MSSRHQSHRYPRIFFTLAVGLLCAVSGSQTSGDERELVDGDEYDRELAKLDETLEKLSRLLATLPPEKVDEWRMENWEPKQFAAIANARNTTRASRSEKEKWLAARERLVVRLNERQSTDSENPISPEQTTELLRQLHMAMPHDDLSLSWTRERRELAILISIAKVDERCSTPTVLEHYGKWRPVHRIPNWLGVGAYTEYFKEKQIEACVSKINAGVANGVARLSEADKRDADVLLSCLFEQADRASLGWNDVRFEVVTWTPLIAAVRKFIDSTAGPLAEKIVKPGKWEKFNRLYDNQLAFCTRVNEYTKAVVDEYLIIRYDYVPNFASRLEPETIKWIKVAKACRQIKKDGFVKRAIYDKFKREQPSTTSRMLERFKSKKQEAGVE